MRESLFEKLKKKELSFILELRKLCNLLNQSYTSTYFYYSSAFKCSPYNVFFEDFNDALLDLIEIDKDYYLESTSDLWYLIENIINLQANLTLDSFLDYLELFRTLLEYKSRDFDTNARQIASIIFNDCDKLGYTFIKDAKTETFRVMLKNPEVEAVAICQKTSVRDKIYRYLMIRNGRIDEKRECIKSLADDIEIICKKYSNIQEYDKLKQFIQCTRHTKDTPKKEFPFYYEDEEKWLDKTFEMIIGVLSFTKTKEIVKEIIKLENK